MSEQVTKEDLDVALKAVREATEELKELKAAGKGGQSELLEKVEKANKTLDELETKNQELITKMGEERKSAEEMKARVDELEVKAAKLGTANGNIIEAKAIRAAEELKALNDWAQRGNDKDFVLDKKYLRTDSNTEGGFLVKDAYDDQIIKPITETSAMRGVCRVKKIDMLRLKMALRASLVQTFSTGEGVTPFSESNSTYKRPQIEAHSVTSLTKITNTSLLGSDWDMQNEITSDFAESRGQYEGALFVGGDGVGKARGFLDTSAGVPTFNAGGSSTYDFDDVILLTGELKTGYKPMYGMNRKEIAFMRTLQDGAGAYIWQSGNLGAGVPNAINGSPYMEIPDMPNKATNATPIVYADFLKLYTIVDSLQAIFLRNPFKENGFVEFTMESWLGGDVVLPEAGVLLKTVA
jgi:HK97 family phage major capsid protein